MGTVEWALSSSAEMTVVEVAADENRLQPTDDGHSNSLGNSLVYNLPYSSLVSNRITRCICKLYYLLICMD